ncbi:MAG: hypothetical protein ABIK66_06155 [candidate division WOR-3 bacterium]
MNYDIKQIIFCVLKKIKFRADLTPESTEEEIKEKIQRKEKLEKMWKEIRRKECESKNTVDQIIALTGELLIPAEYNSLNFELLEGKKVRLYRKDVVECGINFEDDLKNLLKIIKKEYGIIIDFREGIKNKQSYYEIALPKDFDKRYKEIQNKFKIALAKVKVKEVNSLKSIHFLAHTLSDFSSESPNKIIFLVLDEHFEIPIRCRLTNNRGEPTYIKKLCDIAYPAPAPGKRVNYDKNVADNINNGLFKIKRVAQYMKTNKLKKPTLVRKSETGNYLVLTNEVQVIVERVENIVPPQHRYLYVDKTR